MPHFDVPRVKFCDVVEGLTERGAVSRRLGIEDRPDRLDLRKRSLLLVLVTQCFIYFVCAGKFTDSVIVVIGDVLEYESTQGLVGQVPSTNGVRVN